MTDREHRIDWAVSNVWDEQDMKFLWYAAEAHHKRHGDLAGFENDWCYTLKEARDEFARL